MVANPATIGSTRQKSTAPQITTSARPCSSSQCPVISDVTPVAQAVMVAVMGPVAPVKMETLPPTMLMQELGLVKGCGHLLSAIIRRSARRTASRPPTALLKVMATRGASSGVISMPARARARCATSKAWGKIGDVQWAIWRGARNGYGRASQSGTWPAMATGNLSGSAKRVSGPIPLTPPAARSHWSAISVPSGETMSQPTITVFDGAIYLSPSGSFPVVLKTSRRFGRPKQRSEAAAGYRVPVKTRIQCSDVTVCDSAYQGIN